MIPNLSQIFERCRNDGRPALMPFLTSGYPSRGTFVELMRAISSAGADMIEVGIPFSDPMADGETIQQTSQIALNSGANIDSTFDDLSKLKSLTAPIILMSYYNPIYRYGITRFLKAACKLGVKGLIIPDMIPEEGFEIESMTQKQGIDLVYLLAPTSNKERIDLIINRSRGFVYLVSVAGVTGVRKKLPDYIPTWIQKIKTLSKLPVCVGFGISTPRQASAIGRYADGVIVGSALADTIIKAPTHLQKIKRTSEFIKSLRISLNNIDGTGKNYRR
jgi:tryptophan synthase alpha chain